MTEERNALTDLFAACWKDDALKARFMADPKAVLAEHGIDVPDNMNVNVVENSDNTVHITMPMAPDGHEELSMEELSSVAGGGDGLNLQDPNVMYGLFFPDPDINAAIAATS